MPAQFDNRRADNWRVMFAIADLCSGDEDYGDRARLAAAKLEGASDFVNIGTRALRDAKSVFHPTDNGQALKPLERVSSADLVAGFTADTDGPWAEWKNGKPITQAQLARVLKPFGIAPQVIRLSSGGTMRGYLRKQFEDAWERYLEEGV